MLEFASVPPALAVVVVQESSNPSPIPFLLLILAIAGAIVDRRYKKAGGKPSSKRDKIFFWSLAGLFVVLFTVLGFMGAYPEEIAGASLSMALVLFAVWEFGRWRMRRKYPLPKPQTPEAKKP